MPRVAKGYRPKWNTERGVWEYHFTPPGAHNIRRRLDSLPRDPAADMGAVWVAARAMHLSLGFEADETGVTARPPEPAKRATIPTSLKPVSVALVAPAPVVVEGATGGLDMTLGITPDMIADTPWTAIKTKGRRTGVQTILGPQLTVIAARPDTSHLGKNPTFGALMRFYQTERTRQNLPPAHTNEQRYHGIAHLIGHRTVDDLLANGIFHEIMDKLQSGELVIAKFNPKPGTARYRKIKGPMSPGAMRNYRTMFLAVLNCAKNVHVLSPAQIPVFDILPPSNKAEPIWWTTEQMNLITETAKKWHVRGWPEKGWYQRMGIFAMLGRYSGVRSKWLKAVRWQHVDFHTGVIRWDRVFARMADNKTVRAQPMPPPLLAYLQEVRGIVKPKLDDLLLYSDIDIRTNFNHMVDHLELPGSTHAMRHGFITELLMNGYSYDDVYELTGLDVGTMKETYSHIPLSHVRRGLVEIYGRPTLALPAPTAETA